MVDSEVGAVQAGDVVAPAAAAAQAEVMGPWGSTRIVDLTLQSQAAARAASITKSYPWLSMLDTAVRAIGRADVSSKKRYIMMRRLADRINAAVMPESACRRGCASCCHIRVEISGWEARQIANELGLEVLDGGAQDELQAARQGMERAMESFGKACGFLKNGECSIFASRPLACRLHHSLNSGPEMCSPSIPPEESFVPSINLMPFWAGYALVSLGTGTGDISAFFAEAKRTDVIWRE